MAVPFASGRKEVSNTPSMSAQGGAGNGEVLCTRPVVSRRGSTGMLTPAAATRAGRGVVGADDGDVPHPPAGEEERDRAPVHPAPMITTSAVLSTSAALLDQACIQVSIQTEDSAGDEPRPLP
jgi:hypothetical protein